MPSYKFLAGGTEVGAEGVVFMTSSTLMDSIIFCSPVGRQTFSILRNPMDLL